MPMVGRVGAVCAANRRSRAKQTSIPRTYSAAVSAPKQVDVSETTSVDSKPSVMSFLKQQVQEKAGFLKKQRQAFAETVQKGFKMTSSKTSREQKSPSVPAVNLPAARTCPVGHMLEGSNGPREGGWCDGCRSSTALGQHMMSCRPCNYDVCNACFCHPPAPRLLEDVLLPSSWGSGSFAPPARRSTEAACSAHLANSVAQETGSEFAKSAAPAKPEETKLAAPAKAEDSKLLLATTVLVEDSKPVVEAVVEDTKPVVEAAVEAVFEAVAEAVAEDSKPVVEASAVVAKPAVVEESTPFSEARADIEESKPALAAEAIAEQPDQTDEDSIQILAAAVVASVSARAAEKVMLRQESILQQKHIVEEENMTQSPVRGGA